jgi:hypothetical protein
MSTRVSSTDNIINSRDVIRRIENLQEREADVSDAEEAVKNARFEVDEAETEDEQEEAESALEAAEEELESAERYFDEDDQEELKSLLDLQSDAEGYCDWLHGATLINEGHINKYMKEHAQEFYDPEVRRLPDAIRNHIDWEGVAEDMTSDLTQVEFDGVTFYIL